MIDGFREIKNVAKEIGGAFADTGAVKAFGDALSSVGMRQRMFMTLLRIQVHLK